MSEFKNYDTQGGYYFIVCTTLLNEIFCKWIHLLILKFLGIMQLVFKERFVFSKNIFWKFIIILYFLFLNKTGARLPIVFCQNSPQLVWLYAFIMRHGLHCSEQFILSWTEVQPIWSKKLFWSTMLQTCVSIYFV